MLAQTSTDEIAEEKKYLRGLINLIYMNKKSNLPRLYKSAGCMYVFIYNYILSGT